MISYDTLEQYPLLRSNGPPFRNSNPGPEERLVKSFLRQELRSFQSGQAIKVFREPQIEAGFPDIVIAVWEPKIATSWPAARLQLKPKDFQVLQGLRSLGLSGTERLEQYLHRSVEKSLSRLREARLVYRACHSWGARALGDTFALHRLVAIEAKVDDWSTGLRQSARNKWFAGESYLLLGQEYVSDQLIELSSNRGVGLLQLKKGLNRPVVQAQASQLPHSYVTWLFNEWVWRAQLSAESITETASHAA